jgi:hypothetical protein
MSGVDALRTKSFSASAVVWIVQFAALFAVSSSLAAAELPRATWMAEWLRPAAAERTIGVLKLGDGRLSFVAQIGQADWTLNIAEVKRVAVVSGGRSLSIMSTKGEEFVITIMDQNLVQGSPKKALTILERAIQSSDRR